MNIPIMTQAQGSRGGERVSYFARALVIHRGRTTSGWRCVVISVPRHTIKAAFSRPAILLAQLLSPDG